MSPRYETKKYGDVPVLDTVAVHDEETGELTVFAVNRGGEDLPLDLDLRGLPGMSALSHVSLAAGDDPEATNTEAEPDTVTPREMNTPTLDGGRCSVRLPAVSWNVLRFGNRL